MPGVDGRALHRLENRDPVAGGVLDGAGQDLPGQVVVPWGQRDRHLAARAPVQLRRSPRARAAAPGQPPVLGVEQPVGDQLVQVELGGVAGQARARGGLVPTHRLGLRDHVEVQRPPRRLGQRANPADLRREVVHPSHHLLKDTIIDLTRGTL